MRDTLFNSLIIATLALLLAACGAEISKDADDFEPSAGSVDFSTFVAVGDSLTAGYADGALYRHGQINSYPAILAQQFALVGGGAFAQPLMPVGATGSLTIVPIGDLGLDDRRVLIGTGNPDRPVTPVEITPAQSTAIDLPALTGPFNNMGVPGAKSFHLVSGGYGNPALLPAANPFFVRFASATGTTVIADAITPTAPSFFVLWIGNNDILSYATGGGTGVDRNAIDDTAVAGYGPEDITDDTAFAGVYAAPGTGLVDLLRTATNKGVLVNIPKVSAIPFFTTVPHNALPLSAADAAGLNATLAAGYNAVLDGLELALTITPEEAARRRLSFSAGQNPLLINDETLTDLTGLLPPGLVGLEFARPATAADFILLTASPKIGVDAGGLYGISVPMADLDVLIPSEINAIETARQAYNATIKAVADGDPDLVLFDAAAKLNELNTTGIFYGSGGITSEFIRGGGFSLDGVHPTARGYAVIANEIIKVINQGFGANIPPVDPNQYSTVFYQ